MSDSGKSETDSVPMCVSPCQLAAIAIKCALRNTFVCTADQPHLRGEPTNRVPSSVFLSPREIACRSLEDVAAIGGRGARAGWRAKPDSVDEDAHGAAVGAGGHQFHCWAERDSEPQRRIAVGGLGSAHGFGDVGGGGGDSDPVRLRGG